MFCYCVIVVVGIFLVVIVGILYDVMMLMMVVMDECGNELCFVMMWMDVCVIE